MLSYRKLAMRVLGHPLHTGGIDSPRPASQRAAAFILTAAMLTTLAAPAFADIWHIENGDITISAGESGNNVTQNNNTTYGDTNTIITNQNKDTASSHTVTIEAKDKDDKVEVTLKDVNIDTSSRNKAAVSVTGEGDTNIKLDGDNALKSDIYRSGIYGSGSLTISGGKKDTHTAQSGSITAYKLLDAVQVHHFCQNSSRVTGSHGILQIAHIARLTEDTHYTALLVQKIGYPVCIQPLFLHNESYGSRIDVTATGTHHQTFQRSQSHGSIYTFAILDSSDRTTVTNMASDDFLSYRINAKELTYTF